MSRFILFSQKIWGTFAKVDDNYVLTVTVKRLEDKHFEAANDIDSFPDRYVDPDNNSYCYVLQFDDKPGVLDYQLKEGTLSLDKVVVMFSNATRFFALYKKDNTYSEHEISIDVKNAELIKLNAEIALLPQENVIEFSKKLYSRCMLYFTLDRYIEAIADCNTILKFDGVQQELQEKARIMLGNLQLMVVMLDKFKEIKGVFEEDRFCNNKHYTKLLQSYKKEMKEWLAHDGISKLVLDQLNDLFMQVDDTLQEWSLKPIRSRAHTVPAPAVNSSLKFFGRRSSDGHKKKLLKDDNFSFN
jgi:hypothetical protein